MGRGERQDNAMELKVRREKRVEGNRPLQRERERVSRSRSRWEMCGSFSCGEGEPVRSARRGRAPPVHGVHYVCHAAF